MRAIRPLVASVVLVVLAGTSVEAAKKPEPWRVALSEYFSPLYKETKSSFSKDRITEPGTVLVVQKEGLSAIGSGHGFSTSIVKNGEISQKGSKTGLLLGGGDQRRALKVGERLFYTRGEIKGNDAIRFELLSCETFPVVEKGSTKNTRYTAEVEFHFPEGTLASTTPEDVKKVVDSVLAREEDLSSQSPASVELGQTPEQVESAFGKPEKTIKLGAKVIYVYKDMKVIFVDGKVADVE